MCVSRSKQGDQRDLDQIRQKLSRTQFFRDLRMNSLSSLGFGHALLPPCYHSYHGCHAHIPHMSTSLFDSEPAFVRRRNERERERVRHVNQGYARLRQVLPPSLDQSLDPSLDSSPDVQRLDPTLSREQKLGDLSSLHKMRKRESRDLRPSSKPRPKPSPEPQPRTGPRLSKVQTLRAAIQYISALQQLLHHQGEPASAVSRPQS